MTDVATTWSDIANDLESLLRMSVPMSLDVGAMSRPTWTDSWNVVTDVGTIWTDIADDLESLPGMSVPMGLGLWAQSFPSAT